MSILRYANPLNVRADLVAYHCPEHGRFWMHGGHLRQEGTYPEDIEG